MAGGEVGEHGHYVLLLEGRDGAGDESTGSDIADDGEEDHVVGRRQKKWRRDGPWKRRGVEKSKNRLSHPAWKSRKPRGIPTFPQPRRLREIN